MNNTLALKDKSISSNDKGAKVTNNWSSKIESLKSKKADKIKDAEKAQLQYQKDLQKYQKDLEKQQKEQQKLQEQNANAQEKMKMNYQKWKQNSFSAFAGNPSNRIAKPGMSAPKTPPPATPALMPQQPNQKIASYISDIGSEGIQMRIKHATQMRKLNNLIKYVSYTE
jgi:ATP-dependent Clp protease ATP-binding subunit ClpA